VSIAFNNRLTKGLDGIELLVDNETLGTVYEKVESREDEVSVRGGVSGFDVVSGGHNVSDSGCGKGTQESCPK
jgi:hypothetical protein